MNYQPRVETERTVDSFDNGRCRAELTTDVIASGPIDYEHLLRVRDRDTGRTVCVVAAEVNAAPSEVRTGSHVLGLFPGEGHVHLGASDEWARLDAFRERALAVAAEDLGLTGTWRRAEGQVRGKGGNRAER